MAVQHIGHLGSQNPLQDAAASFGKGAGQGMVEGSRSKRERQRQVEQGSLQTIMDMWYGGGKDGQAELQNMPGWGEVRKKMRKYQIPTVDITRRDGQQTWGLPSRAPKEIEGKYSIKEVEGTDPSGRPRKESFRLEEKTGAITPLTRGGVEPIEKTIPTGPGGAEVRKAPNPMDIAVQYSRDTATAIEKQFNEFNYNPKSWSKQMDTLMSRYREVDKQLQAYGPSGLQARYAANETMLNVVNRIIENKAFMVEDAGNDWEVGKRQIEMAHTINQMLPLYQFNMAKEPFVLKYPKLGSVINALRDHSGTSANGEFYPNDVPVIYGITPITNQKTGLTYFQLVPQKNPRYSGYNKTGVMDWIKALGAPGAANAGDPYEDFY